MNGVREYARAAAAVFAGLLLLSLWAAQAQAQDLTPRTFWPAPTGTKVLVLGYARATGDVLMDQSLPVYGVDSEINTGIVGYLQVLDLWGRTSNLLLELPYSHGTTKGVLYGAPARRDFSGFNDPGVTLTVNLIGAPAMTLAEFQALRADPRPILGVSLKVVPPLGHYEEDRLINVGGNRWAARLKLGTIIPLRRQWLLEMEAGAWFFTTDYDFVMGRREQEPIWSAEMHLVRRFGPGFWAALNANYFTGGEHIVDGAELDDRQRNKRIGATLVFPIAGRHAVKLGYSQGIRTRYGSDFSEFVVSYQRLFP